jgi:hypothetical protein
MKSTDIVPIQNLQASRFRIKPLNYFKDDKKTKRERHGMSGDGAEPKAEQQTLRKHQ